MSERKTVGWYISDCIWTILSYILPCKLFVSLRYHQVFGRWIDWKNPRTFTEKLQWMKFFGCRPEYTTMVDKIAVKNHVAGIIGSEYVIPTLGVWTKPEDIDFSELPNRFVLKANHDSGTVFICKDKGEINRAEIIHLFRIVLRRNYYRIGKETPYKRVSRRVFAEEYLDSGEEGQILDYKFFCFGGEPKVFKINYRTNTDFIANYYDLDMNILLFGEVAPAPDYRIVAERPEGFERMTEICRQLSRDIPFVRIDLYNVKGKIYFGEMTFFPTSGFGPFTSEEWDLRLGDWLVLPDKTRIQ